MARRTEVIFYSNQWLPPLSSNKGWKSHRLPFLPWLGLISVVYWWSMTAFESTPSETLVVSIETGTWLVWMHNLNWNYDDNSVLANTMYCDGTLLAFPNVHTYVCIHLATWLPHVQLYIVNLQMMPSMLIYDTWTTTNNHFSTSYTLTFTACET